MVQALESLEARESHSGASGENGIGGIWREHTQPFDLSVDGAAHEGTRLHHGFGSLQMWNVGGANG